MAIKIGTNFSYEGRQFLDTRQRAANRQTLLSWSIAVPVGFEVYCEEDNKWYIYDPEYADLETGHFKLRLEKELENSVIQATVNNNTEDILKLDKEVFPLRFEEVVGGGDFRANSQVLPYITWKLYKGYEYVTADEILVNGEPSRYKERYVSDSYISSSTSYTISAIYGEEQCYTTVNINIYPYRFIFTSSTPTTSVSWITSQIEQPSKFIREFSKPFTGDISYLLDCSGSELDGGVYVHLVFPAETANKIINGEIKVHVGGIEFSDFSVVSPILYMYGETYYNLVFTYPQNSPKLDIILKHQ